MRAQSYIRPRGEAFWHFSPECFVYKVALQQGLERRQRDDPPEERYLCEICLALQAGGEHRE